MSDIISPATQTAISTYLNIQKNNILKFSKTPETELSLLSPIFQQVRQNLEDSSYTLTPGAKEYFGISDNTINTINTDGGKSIGGILTETGSSILGTSDNSVVRASGQLLGNYENIGNTIKSIKSTAAAIKGLKAAKTTAETTKALKAAKLTQLGNYSSLGGTAASVLNTALFGNKTPSEYSGKYGGITQGTNAAWDAAKTSLAFIPGVGQVISGAMEGAELLGNGFKALGAGTDGMTTADAILGSNAFSWNVGALNGAFGHTTTPFTKDTDIYDNIGGSYMGSNALANKWAPYANKKFGFVSNNKYKEAEKATQENIRQQFILQGINNNTQRDLALQQSMVNANNLSNENALSGGWNPYISISKNGSVLNKIFGSEHLNKAYKISVKIEKTITIEPLENKEQKSVIPEGALHANLNHMKCEDITPKGIPVIDIEGNQQAEIERNEIIFCLNTTKKLEELYAENTDEAAIEAGKIITCEILEHTDDRTGLIDTLKQGGTLNVIPEGALHARLHHMDNDNITHKGIPVVANDGEQQAEIECNEIIFRLELTKKLEELCKEDKALEAGKLLVDEILTNTDDRTGLIETV